MTFYLHVVESTGPRQVYRLEDPCVLRIGRRYDCDIVLQERSVSRQHCVLEIRQGRVSIDDTYSRNGTWIEGEQVRVSRPIEVGMRVRVAGAHLHLSEEPSIHEIAYQQCKSLSRLSQFLPCRGGTRKLRLLACAWLRHIGGFPAVFHHFLERAEAFADGLIGVDEMNQARDQITGRWEGYWPQPERADLLLRLGDTSARSALQSILEVIRPLLSMSDVYQELWNRTRDVLGDFFRPFLAEPQWLSWNDQAVRRVARRIYDTGSFEDLPILADALEDAGCEEAQVLAHCRSGESHVKGCWVLDGILGVPRIQLNEPNPNMTLAPLRHPLSSEAPQSASSPGIT